MLNIKIYKENGSIAEVICDGHTGYGVQGEDIVCAAVSTIVQTALLGLLQVAQVRAEVARDDDEAYLRFAVPKDITAGERLACDHILNTMLLGLTDMYQGFSDFIELEVQ